MDPGLDDLDTALSNLEVKLEGSAPTDMLVRRGSDQGRGQGQAQGPGLALTPLLRRTASPPSQNSRTISGSSGEFENEAGSPAGGDRCGERACHHLPRPLRPRKLTLKGYRQHWVVFKETTLSYYKTQDEAPGDPIQQLNLKGESGWGRETGRAVCRPGEHSHLFPPEGQRRSPLS